MSRRRIGQEQFGVAVDRGQHSSLDALAKLIDWVPIDQAFGVISCSAKGEPAWPPMALFKAMLLSTVLRVLGFRADTGANGFRVFSKGPCGAGSGQDPVRRDHPPAQGQGDPGEDRHARRCDDYRLGQRG